MKSTEQLRQAIASGRRVEAVGFDTQGLFIAFDGGEQYRVASLAEAEGLARLSREDRLDFAAIVHAL